MSEYRCYARRGGEGGEARKRGEGGGGEQGRGGGEGSKEGGDVGGGRREGSTGIEKESELMSELCTPGTRKLLCSNKTSLD